MLGNGFFNLPEADLFGMEKAPWRDLPQLRLHLQLTFADGQTQTWGSDSLWTWQADAIRWNSIRGGETVDGRLQDTSWQQPGYPANGWQVVRQVEGPAGRLRYQQMPPMRVTGILAAEGVSHPAVGVNLVDFGENLTGWVELKLRNLRPGDTVRIWYNEVLQPDGQLNKVHSSGHTYGRFQQSTYITAGGPEETFESRFCYHGFRYVQIEGLADPLAAADIQAKQVHTDLQPAGEVAFSDIALNHLAAAVRRTLLNSVHSMPGEEPTREKMGWTFDAGMVTMEAYLTAFSATHTYRKYLQDLLDAQAPNGHVPPIVPTNGWGYLQPNGKPILYDDPWWGGTLVFVARELFQWTGDSSILEEAYPGMRAYVDFVGSTADSNHLVHWSLGDWLDLTHGSKGWGPGLTPVGQTSTACYFWLSREVAATARLLGKTEDARRYDSLANVIQGAFNRHFLQEESGWYAQGSQTGQVLPLWLGMVPERHRPQVEARLLEAIARQDTHLSVGFVGVQPLLKYLSEHGHLSLATALVRQPESPGWLHMLNEGPRSTLGENLNARGYGTGHHPFGACVGQWLYQYLLGIQPGPAAGWKQFTLAPGFESGLSWAKGSHRTPYGEVRLSWEQNSDSWSVAVVVPPNTRAQLVIPGERLEVGPGAHRFFGKKRIGEARLHPQAGAWCLAVQAAFLPYRNPGLVCTGLLTPATAAAGC
ncbi:MAG: hypothetical protein D6722_00975 [Bacteroidetes bacterium]|nr:MAG: hypothetical protein D6722_00975 [Bacteroidota bacterium]